MSQRLFLCITNHHLVAYPWENNAFGEDTTFNQGGEDRNRFQEYLNTQTTPLTAYILIDLTEEELKFEQIPRINPFNRKQMLESRSNRLLRNSPFRHITLLGRNPQDKNQDCVLFSGLTDPEETVLPWLTLLNDQHVSLAGIWSIPLLTPKVFDKVIDSKQKDRLLLSINSGGLRQTFIQNGQIAISRLSHIPTNETEDLVPFLHGEIARMQGYLASQRLYVWSSKLHVHILCNSALFTYLNNAPKEIGTYLLYPLDVTKLATQIGLENSLTTGKMDRLFGQCILQWRIPNHYARPVDTLIFQTMRLRKQIQWAMIGLFAISLILCVFFFFQGRAIQDQQPTLSRQAEEIQRTTSQTPTTHTSSEGERIIHAVKWLETLEAHAKDPRTSYLTISHLLTNYKTILLKRIEWSVFEPVNQGNQQKTFSPLTTPHPNAMQSVQLTGEIFPFANIREAMITMEQFIQELRTLPEIIEVQPIQMPINLGEASTIQGGGTSHQEKANFNLKILLSYPINQP